MSPKSLAVGRQAPHMQHETAGLRSLNAHGRSPCSEQVTNHHRCCEECGRPGGAVDGLVRPATWSWCIYGTGRGYTMIIEAECSTLHRPQVTRPSCNPICQPCRARLASDVLPALPRSHFNGPRLPAAGELDRELFSFFPASPTRALAHAHEVCGDHKCLFCFDRHLEIWNVGAFQELPGRFAYRRGRPHVSTVFLYPYCG
jgi:hypothetical protein